MHMNTTGIVLRETDYKESDKILTVLTDQAGKLTISARGCRKKNSTTAAVSQLLCYSDLNLYEYRGRWSIREGEVLREFRGIRCDLDKLSLGSWFAELSETLTVEKDPSPEILHLLLNTLHVLETQDRPAAQVKGIFELKAMALAGYAPLLDACVVCASEPTEPCLHLNRGVLHCADPCRAALGGGISVPLESATLAAMRHVIYGDEKKLFSFRLSDHARSNFSSVTEAFVLTQLERGFHTLDFYKQITAGES